MLVDKRIIRDCKRRTTGFGMAWIDYIKAFDLVPHSWILEYMRIFGMAQNMVGLMQNSIKNWMTVLIAGREGLGEVHI